MPIQELLEIIGAILFSLTGGAAAVFALSKWLGGIWAGRILENERAALAREPELLVRRRNVYAKLALNMRVFLSSGKPATAEEEQAFLAAYDEPLDRPRFRRHSLAALRVAPFKLYR